MNTRISMPGSVQELRRIELEITNYAGTLNGAGTTGPSTLLDEVAAAAAGAPVLSTAAFVQLAIGLAGIALRSAKRARNEA